MPARGGRLTPHPGRVWRRVGEGDAQGVLAHAERKFTSDTGEAKPNLRRAAGRGDVLEAGHPIALGVSSCLSPQRPDREVSLPYFVAEKTQRRLTGPAAREGNK